MNLSNNKGVTLLALIIYVFIFSLIIGVMTTISSFFYGRIDEVVDPPKYVSEFNKFVMFFAVDVKNYDSADVTSNTITFKNGPIYKYQNGVMYRNDVKIAKDILKCEFTLKTYNVGDLSKNIINVYLQIGKEDKTIFEKNVDFTLKYW